MTTYIGLQADDDANDPQNLFAIALGGGKYVLGVGLYVDVDTTPTPLTSTMLSGFTTPTTIVDGTKSLTTTGASIGTQACKGVLLQADPDNTVDIFVGDASNQRFQLLPGQWMQIPISNVSGIYAKAATGTATLNWLAVN